VKNILRWISDRWVKKEPCVCLTDGRPVPEDGSHRIARLCRNGQHAGYVVLCDEERAKGFVRPVRMSYIHVGVRPEFPTRDLTAEEIERCSGEDYMAFEPYPPERAPAMGRYWTAAQLRSGCGSLTTMCRALSETYARDPGFYGATFCCRCGAHFPVGADGEFIWEEDGTRVGT